MLAGEEFGELEVYAFVRAAALGPSGGAIRSMESLIPSPVSRHNALTASSAACSANLTAAEAASAALISCRVASAALASALHRSKTASRNQERPRPKPGPRARPSRSNYQPEREHLAEVRRSTHDHPRPTGSKGPTRSAARHGPEHLARLRRRKSITLDVRWSVTATLTATWAYRRVP